MASPQRMCSFLQPWGLGQALFHPWSQISPSLKGPLVFPLCCSWDSRSERLTALCHNTTIICADRAWGRGELGSALCWLQCPPPGCSVPSWLQCSSTCSAVGDTSGARAESSGLFWSTDDVCSQPVPVTGAHGQCPAPSSRLSHLGLMPHNY